MAAFFVIDNFLDSDDDNEVEIDNISLLLVCLSSRRSATPKEFGFTDLILTKYSYVDFKHDFRLRRETFDSLLTEMRPYLTYPDRPIGKHPIPPEKQILVYLWYMANQDSMREIARLFGISTFTVHRCARRVSEAICTHLLKKLITWHGGDAHAETARRKRRFKSITRCYWLH